MIVRKLNWKDLGIKDNNGGYIFGLEETEICPPDYIEWFKTEKERDNCIKDNDFEVD